MIVFFLTMVRNLGMRWWKKLRWLPGIGDWVSLCVNRFCSTNSNVIRLIVLRDKGVVFGCQCVVEWNPIVFHDLIVLVLLLLSWFDVFIGQRTVM
jgi:hypothetical protein